MSRYLRPTPRRTYSYKGVCPYSAADFLFMDGRVDPDFAGNVPEELIRTGMAVWNTDAEVPRLIFTHEKAWVCFPVESTVSRIEKTFEFSSETRWTRCYNAMEKLGYEFCSYGYKAITCFTEEAADFLVRFANATNASVREL